MAQLTYRPQVFDRPDLEDAKRIILTATSDLDTAARWERETPYLARLLGERLDLRPGRLVIDYGCGVGRLSKALIERFGVKVLGIDISVEMRAHAPRYVGSNGFSVASRGLLEAMAASGLRADAAISVWVLQHCPEPGVDVALLKSALRPGAGVGVVNSTRRWIPTVEKAWVQDRQDVAAILGEAFGETGAAALDPEFLGQELAGESWCRFYRQA